MNRVEIIDVKEYWNRQYPDRYFFISSPTPPVPARALNTTTTTKTTAREAMRAALRMRWRDTDRNVLSTYVIVRCYLYEC